MAAGLQAPRGTSDVLGDAVLARAELERVARQVLEAAGYARIETPALETAELFAGAPALTVGDGALVLRPEGAAPVCRAYAQHGMDALAQPVKLWYLSSFFRPHDGGQRQVWEVGAEAIGSDDPAVDAETILLLYDLLSALGVSGARLRIASRETAPEDAEHFAAVRELLDAADVAHEVDPALVEGADASARTAFEFAADARLGGGGRHDGLVERIGGAPAPAVGWAAGVEQLLAAASPPPVAPPPLHLYVAYAGDAYRAAAFKLAADARRAGQSARLDLGGRPLAGQLEQAEGAGARYVAILGDDGVAIKDSETGEQRTVEADTVAHFVRNGFGL